MFAEILIRDPDLEHRVAARTKETLESKVSRKFGLKQRQ